MSLKIKFLFYFLRIEGYLCLFVHLHTLLDMFSESLREMSAFLEC